jgi:hypothetical protein
MQWLRISQIHLASLQLSLIGGNVTYVNFTVSQALDHALTSNACSAVRVKTVNAGIF